MKKFIVAALLLTPLTASADYADVIELKLQKCSLSEYMTIVRDFNAWAQPMGYQAEINVKVYHPNPETLIWFGRSADAKTFGKAWDSWAAAQSDPKSTAGKLGQRFAACSQIVSRRSYIIL